MIRSLILILVFIGLVGCEEEYVYPYPCLDGHCDMFTRIDPMVQPDSYQDENGYWHIEFRGFKYFTIETWLDSLHPEYVINKVPLVSVGYDSDYWIAFDTLSFRVPIYNAFGFTDVYKNPIAVGQLTYSIIDLARLHPPLNIAGYQVNKATCFDCPYTSLGSSTNYSYYTRQQIFLNKDMKGDTLKVFVQGMFNTDMGHTEDREHTFNIIVDK